MENRRKYENDEHYSLIESSRLNSTQEVQISISDNFFFLNFRRFDDVCRQETKTFHH